jgi:hypothetical protein
VVNKALMAKFIEPGKLKVESRFWEVLHDSEKGGSITSIKFFNGSNKNILLDPMFSFIDSFWDVLNEKASINLSEGEDCIKVNVSGKLEDINKYTKSNINYNYTYEYKEGHIKIEYKYIFDKGYAPLTKIGISCMNIVPELNCFVARPSHITAKDKIPIAKGWGEKIVRCAAKWGKMEFNGETVFEDNNIPLYLAVFTPGVEGIEFAPASNLEEWTTQLVAERDQGNFQIIGEYNPKSTKIIIEPFNARVGGHKGLTVSGEYKFTFYIGLPKIAEKQRKFMHMAFGNHPWPSDEDIRRWAYSGVNVVRVHNDYHPSGDFWHDGSWPPYDEKGMAELKRVINTCHKYGIKIVPYFSLFELNPKSEVFAEGYIPWRRTVDDWGALLETYPPHYYGFVMCLSSGWKDFLKGYVKKVIKELGFDGVYYDHADYWYCNNKLHSKGDHSTIDDLIDFLEYTRKLIGKDGILLIHASGWYPSIIVENYADGHIMFEDNVHWKEIPPLNEFPPNTLHLTFMNVAPKIPVPAVGVDFRKGTWNLCAKCSILGAFPYWGVREGEEAFLTLFEAFRAFDLSKFKFKNYTMNFVKTNDESIKGAVYYNQERILTVLANVGDDKKNFKWIVDLKRIGWESTQKYHLVGSLGEPITIVEEENLITNGLEDSLEGFRFKVYSITKYFEDRKTVLYNTRPWTENYSSGKLLVDTIGPTGQKAILKFYSPKKPEKISINSNILKEGDTWMWNELTKIGTLIYQYTDSDKRITIQIS